MRISELSARADLPVGTIKFYLREGLLPSGRRTSRTGAEYEESHLERLRLVRALTDAGGLGIAAVRRILTVIDTPNPARLDILATAQEALFSEELPGDMALTDGAEPADDVAMPDAAEAAAARGAADGALDGSRPEVPTRARAWAEARGWRTFDEDLALERLERAWHACGQAGVEVDEQMLDRYAAAMEQVARVDVDAVPESAEDAVRRVIVGTVMIDPMLQSLRLLAQREASMRDADPA